MSIYSFPNAPFPPSDPELYQRGISDYLRVNSELLSKTLSYPTLKVAQRGNSVWEDISETPLVDSTVCVHFLCRPVQALHHRASTGRGCVVDVSMLDCQVHILINNYI